MEVPNIHVLIQKNLGGHFPFDVLRGMSEASEKPWFEEFYWLEHSFKTISVRVGIFAYTLH